MDLGWLQFHAVPIDGPAFVGPGEERAFEIETLVKPALISFSASAEER